MKRLAQKIRAAAGRERGMALIVVLLIISLLAAMTVDFSYASRVDLTLAGLDRDTMRARTLARSGYQFAKALLVDDQNSYDGPGDLWARTDLLAMAQTFLAEGEGLNVNIVDENSRFNLNSLVTDRGRVNTRAYEQFERLLDILGLDPSLAASLVDWIDPDNTVTAGGAEDNYYRSREQVCKNAPIDSLRELILIKGYTPAVIWGDESTKGLLPFVTIHSDNRININTASRIVLQSLDDEITEDLADAIISHRKSASFENNNDLKEVSGVDAKLFARILSRITVSSHFFSQVIEAAVGNAYARLTVITQRNGQVVIPLFWRLE